MSILQPAVSSSAFLKQGILGFQGGGKTLTAALTLIGLYKYTLELGLHDGKKPVGMFDTEKGSDWLIPIFKEAGVPFFATKRKSLSDLLKVMDEAEQETFALLIDSVTHPWREFTDSYLAKKERSYLTMDDWNYLKGPHGWKQFTDRFLNSKLHIVMAGRAGFEYENYVEDGRKKMEKVGTKMKAEGEAGYEPDLLVLMEQVENPRTAQIIHHAVVQKDRSTLLDGLTFDFPSVDADGRKLSVDEMVRQTFGAFLPHIKCLALGQPHVGACATGDSRHLVVTEKRDWQPVQRRIVHDEIKDLLSLHYPGQAAVEKTGRLKAMLEAFNASWAEIEEVMSLPDLRDGYDTLYRKLEGKPSKYASAIAADARPNDINDALPDHSAPKIQASSELLDTPIAVAAIVQAAAEPAKDLTTVGADGIPNFLKRDEPAREVDEPKFLAELLRDLDNCFDMAEFATVQASMMNPFRSKVSKDTWAKAVKLAKRCTSRLIEGDAQFATAAE